MLLDDDYSSCVEWTIDVELPWLDDVTFDGGISLGLCRFHLHLCLPH